MIDDELFPVVLDDEEGGYLASMDGLTMNRRVGWEHKWLNDDLAAQIDAGKLDEHYQIQLDQQFALSGAERILFMASDGTEENCKHLWIERDESRFAALEAGWDQFNADLAEYQPRKQEQAATATVTEDLPAVSVQVSGSLSIVDNFDRFETELRQFVEDRLIRDPKTDQDFADLDNQVKALKKAEDALEAAEAQLLAQVEAVDTAKRRKDMLHKLARDNRLMAEKLVKEQKKAIKLQIAQDGKQAIDDHFTKVEATLDGYRLPFPPGDFNAAMKGKRTIATLRDAADNEVARAKIAINEAADLIRANAKIIADAGHEFLFADCQQLALKDSELVKLEVENRITRHKQEEERRSGRRKVRWFNSLTGDTFHRVVLPCPLDGRPFQRPMCGGPEHEPQNCWTLFFHRAGSTKEWGFLNLSEDGKTKVFRPYLYTREGSQKGWWMKAPKGRDIARQPR
ncbi:hypothetical protein A3725_22125 [Alcanivorax sp. HI0035]|nr:hypothetical protein A3725_22125 [Alcanivorax sp. HI0035]